MVRRSARQVRANLRRQIRQIEQKGERAITTGLILIGNRALYYTPLDTAALQNSQDRLVRRTMSGWRGTIIYTQAYAAALHERDDWSPRRPSDRPTRVGPDGEQWSSGTGGYNPNARSGFLEQGAEDTRSAVDRAMADEMRV